MVDTAGDWALGLLTSMTLITEQIGSAAGAPLGQVPPKTAWGTLRLPATKSLPADASWPSAMFPG